MLASPLLPLLKTPDIINPLCDCLDTVGWGWLLKTSSPGVPRRLPDRKQRRAKVVGCIDTARIVGK